MKAFLILEDGHVFKGTSIGSTRDVISEIVFNTSMTGYLEVMTDPSYAGQAVCMTYPLIGNYGVIHEDFEGKSAVRGYVVREYSRTPSNFRSDGEINDFLIANGIPGIYGIDTRELTKIIRERGVMNAYICDEVPTDLSEIKNYKIENAVESVTSKDFETYLSTSSEGEKYFVVLVDYGAKKNIIRSLCKRGCKVRVVPSTTKAEEILALCPDGVMLSNGPGDPAENVFCIEQIKMLMRKVPIFGICLGHQLMALANGAKTEIRSPRRKPARSRYHDGKNLYNEPEPRICRRKRLYFRRYASLCERERRHLRGNRLQRQKCVFRPVPPGSVRRTS